MTIRKLGHAGEQSEGKKVAVINGKFYYTGGACFHIQQQVALGNQHCCKFLFVFELYLETPNTGSFSSEINVAPEVVPLFSVFPTALTAS